MLNNLYEKLENYRDAFEKFKNINRDKIYKSFDDSNNEQLELLKSLNKIVNALNEFNSRLIVHHPIISEDKVLRDYSKFYNNLVMSKMKHFFFREEPKRSLSDIDISSVELIYNIAKKITILNDIHTIKEELSNYYFNIFLLFDFLYTKDNNQQLIGYFTSFKTDISNYKKIKNKILNELKKIKTEEQFRSFSDEIIAVSINEYLNKPVKLSTPQDIKKVYRSFIHNRKDGNKILLEPFSYFIAYDIWKHGKLLHRLPDITDVINNKMNEYLKYIEDYFNLIEQFYEKGIVDFENIFDFQYKFIDEINQYTIFDDIDNEELNQQTIKNKILRFKKLDYSAKKEVNFHIDKMLCGYDKKDSLKIEEINYLMLKLFKTVKTDNNTLLFGMYSSGAFLSHMYNIFNSQNLPIALFKTFPIIDFQPEYMKKYIGEYSNSVIFDDTIRTGFTFSLLKNAYYRTVYKNLDNYTLSVFAKNKLLDDSYTNFNLKYISNHYYDEITIFKYKLEEDLNSFVDDNINITLKSIIGNVNNKIDYTAFLSNTKIAFSIAYKMAEKIIESYTKLNNDTKKQKIDLFHSSSASKTLALLVAYILRTKGYFVVFDSTKISHYKVAIDLTIKTQHTLKHQMSFVKDINFDDLDLICVINNYAKKNKKIFEVLNA